MPKAVYKNGNALVKIDLENGTKERMTKADEFDLSFPETIDLNIGTRCDGHCPYCYINASENGVDADLSNVPFIDSLHPYTEVAINGNSVDHPQLIQFLEELKKRRIIANITVNQIHFERKISIIKDLADRGLVKGIGISLRRPTPGFVRLVQEFPNAVIHTIVGILTPEDIKMLSDKNLKILILGYKDLGRGVDYKTTHLDEWEKNEKYLYSMLGSYIGHFNVCSFDNLAIAQLGVKRFLTDEQWNEFYMGDEGTASMFVDLVTQKFGVSSLCSEDEMFPMTDDVEEMFNKIKIKQLTNI